MIQESFYNTFLEHFGRTPTPSQSILFSDLEKFMYTHHSRELFLIKGYAGTGKTSVLSAFVQSLQTFNIQTILLAPTGRAAKVFSLKAKKEAFTIHKHIYQRKSKVDLAAGMGLRKNLFKHTVFFIDEASTIGDYTLTKGGEVNQRNLLEDIIEYVFSGENCRLVMMGDEGQLPPVGSDFSPALNKDYLVNHFPSISVTECRLTEVLRQAEDSEVLRNATLLRNTDWVDYPKFDIQSRGDLIRLSGLELQDQLESSYSSVGGEETILITRSNKQANAYNQQIRGRILWYEEALCSGDILMIVKNNYFWLGEDTKIGFIANGEMVRIVRVQKTGHMYGFEFAHLIVRFVDYEELGDVEVIIHTESLTVDAPSLSRERMKELFFSVERDYAHIREKKKRYEAILSDPYFNALQVKYAYAVTCHKSQGGQWSDVYIDQGFINEETLNADYYRWLYTALTRATNRVFLVNFSDEFFT